MKCEDQSGDVAVPERDAVGGPILATIPSARAQRSSLALPAELGIEDWCEIGVSLFRLSESSAWWIGDWLLHGQVQYPDRYRQAMRDTGLEYQTLRNYAWAARAYPPSRRRDGLSVQHHVETAALPASEQDHWLDLAVRLKWSRNELRRQIRASQESSENDQDAAARPVSLQLAVDHAAVWKDAARVREVSLSDWMIETLDQAAEAALNGSGGPPVAEEKAS